MGTSSFKSGDKPVEKARGPFGSQIIPQPMNADQGTVIGGFTDHRVNSRHLMANTARNAAGPGAAKTTQPPTMSPPTPYPGKSGKASPNPMAPTKLLRASKAKGTAQGGSAETAGMGMARLARGGNKIMLDTQPVRHQQPALPAPMASFPAATGPQSPPVPAPAARGRMSGVMQGSAGKASAGNTAVG